jgi:Ca2+-binding protein (EF-Hand superfamily)
LTLRLEAAIDKVRSKLKARGSKGYIGIQRVFKIMDDNNDREISYNEFAKAMKDFGLGLTDEETRLLFQEFDVDRSGQISIDEFIRGIRGEMNGFRKNLVLTCFKILDKNGDGTLQV